MAEISWIKLKTTMFDDEKIRLIQAVPESDAIIVIWIRLLVLAGKTNDDGLIYIQRNMPYTEEMLATLFGKNVNTVKWTVLTVLPAASVLVATLGKAYGWNGTDMTVLTINAVATFLGVITGVSAYNLKK
ncbi:phage replisome organizer N-terminal domain-containing protein [Enterococcus faecium]